MRNWLVEMSTGVSVDVGARRESSSLVMFGENGTASRGRDGAVVRIRDIGATSDSVEEDHGLFQSRGGGSAAARMVMVRGEVMPGSAGNAITAGLVMHGSLSREIVTPQSTTLLNVLLVGNASAASSASRSRYTRNDTVQTPAATMMIGADVRLGTPAWEVDLLVSGDAEASTMKWTICPIWTFT